MIIGAPVLVDMAVAGALFISQLRGEPNVIKGINGEGTKDIGGRMTLKDVEALLQEDGKAWAELCAVLDAHPDLNLHDAGSKPFNSRDTYAHVARWMEYYAAKINAFVDGKPIPLAGTSTEEVNARWQAEDASLSLEAARRWAENAYEIHERTLRAVPISMWGDELEKVASIGAANHFREHLSYITLEDARPYPS